LAAAARNSICNASAVRAHLQRVLCLLLGQRLPVDEELQDLQTPIPALSMPPTSARDC
jgi:hypothetical protein